MKIEIGKRYQVDPAMKKSAEEVETFSDGEGRYVQVSELWRWATYFVTPQNEFEVKQLEDARDNGEPVVMTDFEESEMDSTWDGCASDIKLFGLWESEEAKEKFEEQYWEDRWELLEKEGFQPEEFELTIYNGITIELSEEE